jgi:hypothetical protein
MKKRLNIENPRSEIPPDENLPGLSAMVDGDIIKAALSESFEKAGLSIKSCKISYIRYKPRTNCIIVYRVKFDGGTTFKLAEIPVYVKLLTGRDYKIAEGKARLHRWVNPEGIGTYLLFPEHQAILYCFPNDPVIDGLRVLEHPKKIQRILYRHHEEFPEDKWRISNKQLRISIMRYKPERRAVMLFRTKAYSHDHSRKKKIRVYARIYGDNRGGRIFDLQNRLYQLSKNEDRLRVPEPIAYLADRRILLMKELKGEPLLDCIRDGRLEPVKYTAAALAFLHTQHLPDLEQMAPDSLLEGALASHQMISEIAPDLSDETGWIHDNLTDMVKNLPKFENGFVHGDFYHGQAIISGKEAGIIDFDRSYTGDPGADLGNFIANLRLLHIRETLTHGEKAADIFLSQYEIVSGKKLDKEIIEFWTAFSLFQLAVNPFREYDKSWRQITGRILKECRLILK